MLASRVWVPDSVCGGGCDTFGGDRDARYLGQSITKVGHGIGECNYYVARVFVDVFTQGEPFGEV
ncbi:MAG: hypothetical protein A2Y78_08395 [Acidobacteria bacterium RBG_13_68_16]|nr:MAG: hypothetical protein A2Y78_08395 [Acidobacteria bacterium RBG_13_68_16]